jgi:hypothetical protein
MNINEVAEKVYLLKSRDGEYAHYDLFSGWSDTNQWQFAYHFWSFEDAKQVKDFLNYSIANTIWDCPNHKKYRVVSRKLEQASKNKEEAEGHSDFEDPEYDW